MKKLGFYLQKSNVELPGVGDVLFETFRKVRPPVLLIHADSVNSDLLRLNRKVGGVNAFVVGRLFKEPGQQEAMLNSSDPAATGRQFADEILNKDPFLYLEKVEMADGSKRPLIDAWMSLNEPIPGPAWTHFQEQAPDLIRRYQAYDRFQVAFRTRLQEKGIEAVAFNFGAGNFTQPEHYLEHFPLTLAAYQYLGFHEYAWPHMNPEAPDPQQPGMRTSSSVGLYRHCMEGIRQQYGKQHRVIVTEAGLTREHNHRRDHVNLHPQDLKRKQTLREETRGWLCFTEPLSQEYYYSSLQWYNDFLGQDDFAMGACLYQISHSNSFISHRHLGEDEQGNKLNLVDWIANPEHAPSLGLMAATTEAPPRRVTIRGQVSLQENAVIGATVRLISSQATLGKLRRTQPLNVPSDEYFIETMTGVRGNFRFAKVPLGEYRLEILAPGAHPLTMGFSCQGPIVLDLVLTPALLDMSFQASSSLRRIDCGINIDPRNIPHGNPSAQAISELGATWVRLVFKNRADEALDASFTDYDRVVNNMRQAGINVLMILNNESCPGKPVQAELDDLTKWQSYREKFVARCREIAQHFGANVQAYQIWNEPDYAGRPGYEPTIRARIYGDMLKRAFEAIKAVSSATVITAGMAAGNPQWVAEAMAATSGKLFADALAVHPYGRRPTADWPNADWGGLGPETLVPLLKKYQQVANKPLWVTEFGTEDRHTVVDFSGLSVLAQDLFPGQFFAALNENLPGKVHKAFWFCWSNGMVANMGVVDESGAKKPSHDAFQQFARLPVA